METEELLERKRALENEILGAVIELVEDFTKETNFSLDRITFDGS
jgi:hypothetical protein